MIKLGMRDLYIGFKDNISRFLSFRLGEMAESVVLCMSITSKDKGYPRSYVSGRNQSPSISEILRYT